MINYTLVRSKRKKLSLHITKKAEVEVRAPHQLSKKIIDDFVINNEEWIITHLEEMNKRNEKIEHFILNDGDQLRLLGKQYPLVFCPGEYAFFDGECFYVVPSNHNAVIKDQVVNLYRQIAKHTITEKVAYYADLMKVNPTAVKINSAKTRWGSCSSKKSLNFSWKLIMAPESAVNYVVVHELAHIFELNHSKQFWEIVEHYYPTYKEEKIKLEKLIKEMAEENWEL